MATGVVVDKIADTVLSVPMMRAGYVQVVSVVNNAMALNGVTVVDFAKNVAT